MTATDKPPFEPGKKPETRKMKTGSSDKGTDLAFNKHAALGHVKKMRKMKEDLEKISQGR